jgi:hypothetical protein
MTPLTVGLMVDLSVVPTHRHDAADIKPSSRLTATLDLIA